MAEIPWASLASIGPWGLVTLCVILIFFGRLVPGRERDYWRKAFFAEQQMRKDLESTGVIARKVLTSLTPDPEDEHG